MSHQILIVTSDSTDANILCDVLHHAKDGPFITEIATTLADALAKIAGQVVDAILVDLNLPDSQGMATFDKIFSTVPHIPILTLSSMEEEESACKAVSRGSQGYL